MFVLASILMLSACSNHTSEGSVEKNDKKSKAESVGFEDLIGEKIVEIDETFQLPFDEIVLDGVFSEDGQVKLFRTHDYIVLVDSEEIIYTDKIKHYEDKSFPALMVSDDVRVEKGKVIGIPLDEEIDLKQETIELKSNKVEMAEQGHVLMPVMEHQADKDNLYTLSMYYIDLSKASPHTELLFEEEVPDNQASVFLNANESGFYLSEKGKLEYHEL